MLMKYITKKNNMEKTLQEIEAIWNYKEFSVANNIQNHELAKQFANGEIILEHTGKYEDIWQINNIIGVYKLSHANSISYYGGEPIPYNERYFFTIGPTFYKNKRHVIWDIPPFLKQKKPIIKVEEIYKIYNKKPDE